MTGAKPARRETRDERRARIAERVRELPTEPGCYLMRDARGEIFYVGKAADLRARVRSYFSGSDTRQFVDWLDDLLVDLDVIVVRNEKEALLLERTLVRTHQPRFNVKLRDDKNFIHLRLKTRPATDPSAPLRQRYPRVEVARGPAASGDASVRTFGPFHSATAARATLRVLNRHFQLRTCRDAVLENRARPCLQHQIGRCPAPCVFDVPDYGDALVDAALFLAGRRTELIDRVKARMLDAAKREDFELAARARDQLSSLASALDDQVVTDVEHRRNQDVWVCERRGGLLVVVLAIVRDGRMQGVETYDFDSAAQAPLYLHRQDAGQPATDDLLGSVLNQHYADAEAEAVPDEILLGDDIGTWSTSLAEVLSERRGKRVDVRVPQRGPRNQLVDIARKNAIVAVEERRRRDDVRQAGLAALTERLVLKRAPHFIECFDISLFQGTDAVASQVCFRDGEPDKSLYRRMNIHTVEGTDDFAMLHEALVRRLRRGKERGDLPDLIIVDGGKGQLNAALAAFRDVGVLVANAPRDPGSPSADAEGLVSVALASIAKARTFNTRSKRGARPATPREDRAGLADDDETMQMSPERLFLPGVKDPLPLRPHTPERFLVERLRDEAHRFAITAHRKRRARRTLTSALDEIAGIGPARRKRLLARFGSLDAIADAPVGEVAAVPGIGAALAAAIHAALRGDDAAVDDDDADVDSADDGALDEGEAEGA